jgi:hypothetical protein
LKNRKSNRREINGITEKQCTKCNKWFAENADNFYMRNKNKIELGYNAICKECSRKDRKDYIEANYETVKKNKKESYRRTQPHKNQQNKDWQQNHKEYYRAYVKQYCHDNPDKVHHYNQKRQHKNHQISKEEWDSCKQYFDSSCAYCGMSEEKHKEIMHQQLHKEHVVFNGSIYLDNCVPACRTCNSKKWEHDMEEWYKQQDYFSEERLNKIKQWTTEDYKKYIENHQD